MASVPRWRIYSLPSARGVWYIAKPLADGHLVTVTATESHAAAVVFADLCARGTSREFALILARRVEDIDLAGGNTRYAVRNAYKWGRQARPAIA